MKLNLTLGCISDNLSADNIKEVDMTPKQKQETWDKIVEFLSKQKVTDGPELNELMQFACREFGTWGHSKHRCECCGDTIEWYNLEI